MIEVANTPQTIRELLQRNGGKIFRVTFIKRTDGTERVMVCRIGVRKGVTGAGLAFDPAKKNLLTVYDVQKEGHRMVNLETVISVAMLGETFETVDIEGVAA